MIRNKLQLALKMNFTYLIILITIPLIYTKTKIVKILQLFLLTEIITIFFLLELQMAVLFWEIFKKKKFYAK